jgi:hypothetical protein
VGFVQLQNPQIFLEEPYLRPFGTEEQPNLSSQPAGRLACIGQKVVLQKVPLGRFNQQQCMMYMMSLKNTPKTSSFLGDGV